MLGSESYYPNVDGGAVAERQLALRLAQKGHQVRVVAPSFKGMVNYSEVDGRTVIYRPRAVTFPLLKEYKASIRPFPYVDSLVASFRPDIIHIHNPYPIGYALLKSARRRGIPVVGSNHLMPENFFMTVRKLSFLYRPLKRLGWAFIAHFYNRCAAAISPSNTAIGLLKANGLRVPGYPMSNGVDLSRFRPGLDGSYLRRIYRIPEGGAVVLYAGRLGGEKSLDVLIRAFAMLPRATKATLVFSGTGPDAATLKALADSVGISSRMRFVGFVPDRDFPSLYGMADIFAISSTAELQSIVTLEAMGCGLPVVAADSNALPELCHHGENGFLFPPFMPGRMASCLGKLLSSPALRARMGAASRRIVRPHDYGQVIGRFEALYREVIESFRKRGTAR
jgi:glycosyltransferase involved in cell wall biosynthesis